MKKNLGLIYLNLLTSLAFAQELKYTNGNDKWNADSLGNHRAVLTFNGTGTVAKTVIVW